MRGRERKQKKDNMTESIIERERIWGRTIEREREYNKRTRENIRGRIM